MTATANTYPTNEDFFWFLRNIFEPFVRKLEATSVLPSVYQERRQYLFEFIAAFLLGRDVNNKPLERDAFFHKSDFTLRRSIADPNHRKNPHIDVLRSLGEHVAAQKTNDLSPVRAGMIEHFSTLARIPKIDPKTKASGVEKAYRFAYAPEGHVPARAGAVVLAEEQEKKPKSWLLSFAAGTGMSILLSTASKLAIVAALAPVAPVIAPVAAAAVAGVIVGRYKSGRNGTHFGLKQAFSSAAFGAAGGAFGLGALNFMQETGFGKVLTSYFAEKTQPVLAQLNPYLQPALAAAKPYIEPALAFMQPAYTAAKEKLASLGAGFDQTATASMTPDTATADNDVATSSAAVDPFEPRKVKTIVIKPDIAVSAADIAPADVAPVEDIVQPAAERFDPGHSGAVITAAAETTQNLEQAFYDAKVPKPDFALAETPPDTSAAVALAPDIVIKGDYIPVHGDSLWKLTRTYYGISSADGDARWDAIEKILAANPHMLGDPTALPVGEPLKMPDLAQTTAAADCNVVRGKIKACTYVPS